MRDELPDGPYDTAPPREEPFTSEERGDVQDARESIRVYNEGASQTFDRIEARISRLLPKCWKERRTAFESALEQLDDVLSEIEDQMHERTASDPYDYESKEDEAGFGPRPA